MRYRSHATALATLCAALIACGDAPTDPSGDRDAIVVFDVQDAAGVIGIAIEVSGPGIDSLLVFNLAVANGSASGTARVPAGGSRRLTARAFDAFGVETHRGDTTVTLLEGPNPAVSLLLAPLTGSLPITLTFGGSGLTVTPGDTTVAIGATVQFTAGGVDSIGNTILSAAVVWSSSDPGLVLVDPQGLATARAVGEAFVIATYQGASRGRRVTVTP